MKTFVAALALSTTLALGGCVVVATDEGLDFDHDIDFDDDIGTVFGADITADIVTFRVTSNGCTDETHFDIDVDRHGSDKYSVGIMRTKPDRCRALLRDGVEVSWSYEDLGIPAGADVRVENQVRRR